MILVAGSANIDFVTQVPHIPAPGETVLGPSYALSAGGKGANQAVACARSGGQVRFLGALGIDTFAAQLRASFAQSGVHDLTLSHPTLPTGAAFISVSEEGENAITVASGANASLGPGDLPSLDDVGLLVLQLEVPLATVTAFAKVAQVAGVKVVLNAAPARSLPAELLNCVDVLVVNEQELAALHQSTLAGAGDLRGQLQAVQARGPQVVIVTLGSQGSLALEAGHWHEMPAFPVTPLDTTGAGDTYVGVLAAGLDSGLTLPDAMQRASVAAALACTRLGAQPSMPWKDEIEAALGADSSGAQST